MPIKNVLITLAVSVAVAAYLFYAMIPVPADIEQKDEIFWIFAKRKVSRGLSVAGEIFGFGNRLQLYRQLSSTSLLSMKKPVNYTDVKVRVSEFDGVPVRIYEPKRLVNQSPGLIWIHGGGWTTGSAEADDYLTTELCRRLGILVVSINYRLAPEYQYPQPFDDCVRATVHFLVHASEMGVDAKRIAIAGASAGGNLAAAVSLRLRDIGQVPMPSIQILFVPCLQAADFNTPSYQRDRNIAFLPRYWMVNYWLWYALGLNGHQLNDVLVANDHTSSAVKKSVVARLIDHKLIQQKYVDASYVPDSADHGSEAVWNDLEKVFADPYFAPLMDSNLRNVPPAYIVTAEHDVLRDDGILYVRRLLNDGVAVKHRHYDHGFHALLDDFTRFNHAAVVVDDLVEFLAMQL